MSYMHYTDRIPNTTNFECMPVIRYVCFEQKNLKSIKRDHPVSRRNGNAHVYPCTIPNARALVMYILSIQILKVLTPYTRRLTYI